MTSNDGLSAPGPVVPYPLTSAYTTRGARAWTSSHEKPSRSITPGRKFETTTSARSISRQTASRPASLLRSSVTLRLFRLTAV